MAIIVQGLILFLLFKRPAKYIKEPTDKNRNWCITLSLIGTINLVYLIYSNIQLNDILGGSIYAILIYGLAALNGWGAYKNYMAIKDTIPMASKKQVNKFCIQCGYKIEESNVFCSSCGAEIPEMQDAEPKSNGSTTFIQHLPKIGKKDLKFWVTLGSSVCVILIMTQRWIHLEILDAYNNMFSFLTGSTNQIQTTFSLFKFSDILNNLNQYANINEIKTASIFLTVAALIVIVTQGYFIYNFVTNHKNTKNSSTLATAATCIISILFLFIINTINKDIAEETYNIVRTTVKSTAMPYLAMIFSILGRVLLINME